MLLKQRPDSATPDTRPVLRVPRGRALRRDERAWGVLYAAPAVVMILAFVGYPLGSIAYHAFTRWDGVSGPTWVGAHNFSVLLHDRILRRALINNCLFALTVPVQLVLPLGLAFLIHQRLPGWRLFRAAFFLPAVISTVVVGLLASFGLQLDGPLNQLLKALGLGVLTRNWLADASSSIPMVILVVIWANFGYNVLIYLGGMTTLDPSLGEAARIDGASSWRVLWNVYVPNLRRVMELVLVTSTVAAFANMFAYIYTITRGGPAFDTYVGEYYVYSQAFTQQNLGYASAVGLTLAILLSSIGYFQIRVLTRSDA